VSSRLLEVSYLLRLSRRQESALRLHYLSVVVVYAESGGGVLGESSLTRGCHEELLSGAVRGLDARTLEGVLILRGSERVAV
jgi:hypothetical protein